MRREQLSRVFSNLAERQIAEAYAFDPGRCDRSPERIVHMKKKRMVLFALAAALILALGITAYASWGIPHSVATHSMPLSAEYTDLSQLPKLETEVGYPVTVPESFSNGYTFAKLRVDGQAVIEESDAVLTEYYVVNVTYSKKTASDLKLEISPAIALEGGSEAPAPSERRTVNGVTVDLSLDHYKVVPEDYHKTEDDLSHEVEGHYYISFSSGEIREYEIAYAGFELDGVIYSLTDLEANEDSFDTLVQIAGEIIEAS